MSTNKTALEIFVQAAPVREQGLAPATAQELESDATLQAERYLGVAALELAEPLADTKLPVIRADTSVPTGPTGTAPDFDQSDDPIYPV